MTNISSDEERAAMSLQMREECCSLQSSLDLDQVLRELQERIVEANDFSRIGPFGILSMEKETPVAKLDSAQSLELTPNGCEKVGEVPRIPTPSLGLSVSPINWAGLEEFQGWESFATDSADVFAPSNYDPTRLEPSSEWDLAISSPQPYLNQITEDNRLEAIIQDEDTAAPIELDSFIGGLHISLPKQDADYCKRAQIPRAQLYMTLIWHASFGRRLF
jgi:arginine metabolism regulation protein II